MLVERTDSFIDIHSKLQWPEASQGPHKFLSFIDVLCLNYDVKESSHLGSVKKTAPKQPPRDLWVPYAVPTRRGGVKFQEGYRKSGIGAAAFWPSIFN